MTKFRLRLAVKVCFFPHIICCFHLPQTVLCSTCVNKNASADLFLRLLQRKHVIVDRIDTSRACTNDSNSMALSDVKCLFLSMCSSAFRQLVLTQYLTGILEC